MSTTKTSFTPKNKNIGRWQVLSEDKASCELIEINSVTSKRETLKTRDESGWKKHIIEQIKLTFMPFDFFTDAGSHR